MTTTLAQAAAPDADVDPATHGVLHVLDRSGDTKLIWDRNNADEIAAARAMFDTLVGEKRFVAYSVDNKGDKSAIVRTFDPDAEKLILSPPLVGG